MKTSIDISDFLILLEWVNSMQIMSSKVFIYGNLLDQAETYKLTNTPIDMKVHYIEDFLLDVYKVHIKIKNTFEEVNELLAEIVDNSFVDKFNLIGQVTEFNRICDDIMFNCEFETNELKAIQKGYLAEKLPKLIENEEYEKAAMVRDLIK